MSDASSPDMFRAILQNFSVQTVPSDGSLATASDLLPAGTKVFIGSLPNETIDRVASAAADLEASGLIPVPHLAARNIGSTTELRSVLQSLTGTAAVTEVLVIAGDRDEPAGGFYDSLEIVQSGLLEEHGVQKLYVGCYPERHPRISQDKLDDALASKLMAARQAGLEVGLVSQFCFSAEPIIRLARRFRASGIEAPFRAGVAGPTSGPTLLKYARKFGVDSAVRTLSGRSEPARNVIAADQPAVLIRDLASAQAADPGLGIDGLHFFTFGSAAKSAKYVTELLRTGLDDSGGFS